MLGRQRIFGMDLRRLGFIYHVSTERQDLIAVPWHPGIRRAIWNHLADHRHLWDVLILPQIPTDSPTARELPELAAEEGFLTGRWPSSVALHIPLKGRWEDYVNGLDRKFRYNIRSRMRRLSALGRVGLEVVDARDQVPSALEDGLRIEAAAWKGRVGTAIACQPQVRDFYTRLAQRAAMRDWLRLHFLTFEGRRIAFAYNLEYKGVLYLLKTGYDPQYSAYSPSTMLATLLLQRAFERRVTRYELLGDAEPWKLEWTGHSTSHCWVFVMRDTARTRLVHFAKFHLLPRLKKSRHFSILHQSFLALPRILRRFGSTRARP